jgi:Family of unknown function (DUF6411)
MFHADPIGEITGLMLIGAIIAFCVLVFIAALLAPRLSQYLQRGGDKPLAAGQRTGSKAPGSLGRWAQKPFSKSRRAVSKSGSAGRRTRSKLD